MTDVNESSSENNIKVNGIVDFANSPHKMNKKGYNLTLITHTDGSNEYRSRIGFNLYPLPLGLYTMMVEFYPPEMDAISVSANGQTIYIAYQITKSFSNYTKTLIKFHQNSKTTPDYIFIDLHGKITKSNTNGHLIVYGIKDYHSSADPSVYDNWFTIENGKVEMQTSLDLQNHKVTNLADPTDDKDAINKKYTDDNFLNKNTGITSDLSLNNNRITNLSLPRNDDGAISKTFLSNNSSNSIFHVWNS